MFLTCLMQEGSAACTPEGFAVLVCNELKHNKHWQATALNATCKSLCISAFVAMQAATSVDFWGVFYPWVFAYLGFYFLRVRAACRVKTYSLKPLTKESTQALPYCVCRYKQSLPSMSTSGLDSQGQGSPRCRQPRAVIWHDEHTLHLPYAVTCCRRHTLQMPHVL